MAKQQPTASEELFSGLPEERIYLAVHDASRLGWNVAVIAPNAERVEYEIVVELEMPTNLLGPIDLWGSLQTYARLDASDASASESAEGFRRSIVSVAVKLARARDGFVRHCALVRSGTPGSDELEVRSLLRWVDVARLTLARARDGLLSKSVAGDASVEERRMADEFLSGQLWTALTDCARALEDLEDVLEDRPDHDPEILEPIEHALSTALRREISYRRKARLPNAEPANAFELEHLVSRLRWLKRHFEHAITLDFASYEVASRVSGWLSALTAMVAYLWFLFWRVTLEREDVGTIGSGVVVVALITAVAYASRERLKEAGRNWLAGRVQRMFAQRVTRYHLPGRRAPVIIARESFSRSAAQRVDPIGPEGLMHDVTVVRFSHRGKIFAAQVPTDWGAPHVRLFFRLDLSQVFPRLQDAVRGFASPDPETGRLAIVDVARNYDLCVSARVRSRGDSEEVRRTLVLNKNGLVRLAERE